MKRFGKGPLRVALYEPSGRGGVCQYTYNLADSLARAGCAVTLLTSHEYELEALPRQFRLVPIFKPSRIAAALTGLRRLSKRLSRRGAMSDRQSPAHTTAAGADSKLGRLRQVRMRVLLLRVVIRLLVSRTRILHFQWSMHQEEDLRFLRLAKRLGIATVYTAHNLLPHDAPKPEERQAFAALYRSVDQIVVFAQSIRDQVIDSFSISPDRVSVVPQGSASLLLQKFSQAFARHELGIPAASRVVLFFGHIKRYKGLEYLVEAFDRLHGLVEDVLLLVAGEISASDPGDHREYSDLIERLRIRKDVVCHAEYIPTSHVGLFFAAADVVALPYSHTYHSAILMTAYAAGKPVVVTDTGMLADDVQEGLTGFIVPPKDVSSLADRLAEILVRPDMRRRMGEAAQHLAETRYSWPSVAEKTISLYRQLLGAAGPPPRGNARAATPHAGRRAGRRGPRSLTPPGL